MRALDIVWLGWHRKPVFRISGQLARWARVALVVAACAGLTSGHLAALQMVAWGGMIIRYASEDGLLGGAAKALSGKDPCGLCKRIATARDAERKQAPETAALAKLDGIAGEPAHRLLEPPFQPRDFLQAFVLLPARSDEPPLPVPRRSHTA